MPTAQPGAYFGLLMPPAVVQPFFLRYRRDDLHVMAFIKGHPRYEAVEAMVKERPGGRHAIRAIITRHDQSQIDHINDDEIWREMRGAEREVYRREIDFLEECSGATPRARVAFTSMADERIVLDLSALAKPQPGRSGFTDPGGHSSERSLPLMWRGASALAGPATHVTVDGVRHAAPRYSGGGPAGARQGFFTKPHCMGVVRAGKVIMKILEAPLRPRVGAQWAFEVEGREVRYCASAAEEGRLRIESQDGETVIARAHNERLALLCIGVPDQGNPAERLILAFDAEDGFTISMAGQQDLVVGRVSNVDTDGGSVVTLAPTRPSWAATRTVCMRCLRHADQLTFITTIGG